MTEENRDIAGDEVAGDVFGMGTAQRKGKVDKMKKKAGQITDREAAAGAIPAGDEVAGTDIAVGGIEATDIFSLSGDFVAQSSSNDTQKTRASAKGADGDEVASNAHDTKNAISCTYLYKATSGDIAVTNLYIGKVTGGYHIDQIVVAYSNAGWPMITVTGHNHGTAAHADGSNVMVKPSLTLPAGFGCPELFTNGGATSSIVSATYTLSAEHTDVLDKDGEHLAGDNHGGMETVAAQYYGTPSLTTTGWDVTSSNAQDSNSDFDQVSISATRAITRTAP